MTPDDLILDLALQSMADPAALPVLGDALQETAWGTVDDARAIRTVILSANPYDRAGFRTFSDAFEREFLRVNCTMPTPTFARGVAAYLLFREWQTSPWYDDFILTSGEALDRLAETLFGLRRRPRVVHPNGLLSQEVESDAELRERCRLAINRYGVRIPRFSFEIPVPLGMAPLPPLPDINLEPHPGTYLHIEHPDPDED